MKKALAILLALTLLLSVGLLAACKKDDGAKDDPQTTAAPTDDATEPTAIPADSAFIGTWVGSYTKMVGGESKNEETFSLTLNADGTGKHARDDYEFNVTWTQDGDTITMNETFIGDPIVYTGSVNDGELRLFNGDPTDRWTYEYVYQKG